MEIKSSAEDLHVNIQISVAMFPHLPEFAVSFEAKRKYTAYFVIYLNSTTHRIAASGGDEEEEGTAKRHAEEFNYARGHR